MKKILTICAALMTAALIFTGCKWDTNTTPGVETIPNGFVEITGVTLTGSETWTPSSSVLNSAMTIPTLWMCDHEVTQAEYEQYCTYGGSYAPGYDESFPDGDNYPAYCVSWYDALVYCNKLSIAKGLTPCYTINGSTNPSKWGNIPSSDDSNWDNVTCNFDANGYRLPTQAEWEYAARGGESYDYSGSSTIGDVAWYEKNSSRTVHEVKTKASNLYGLYDMSGNVYEWVWDQRENSALYHCVRGGNYNTSSDCCKVTYINNYENERRGSIFGFRVVRTVK